MPRGVGYAEVGMEPVLSFSEWVKKYGHTGFGWSEQNFEEYQNYKRRWQSRLQGRTRVAYAADPQRFETPAEAANRMAEEEWQAGMGLLAGSRAEYEKLGTPEDVQTQYLINREAERNAAAAGRDINRLRGRAAASGLGRTGGTGRQEQLIRSEMTRRNIMGERDIRTGVRSERLGGLERTSGALAQAHLGRSFQLPESGGGTALRRPYQNYDWLYGQQRRPLSTLRKPAGARVIGFG
ncbi:MAG: hypothetical protein ACYTBJ_01655 [Planctomycetota bacterium]|jgi:hypothetical protein